MSLEESAVLCLRAHLPPAAPGTLGLGNMLPEAETAGLKVSLLQAVSPEPKLWPRASARMEESSLCTVGLGLPAVLSHHSCRGFLQTPAFMAGSMTQLPTVSAVSG